jgi:hypothetical protein
MGRAAIQLVLRTLEKEGYTFTPVEEENLTRLPQSPP